MSILPLTQLINYMCIWYFSLPPIWYFSLIPHSSSSLSLPDLLSLSLSLSHSS
ncbi:hypothetical protein RchiOBHm_Chr2g0165221 [Rosa chinensis]|uniref:Uncharacterized protein n=1 Tax=Rosa chinensis TaxID=74649 RepID=A0A2P6S3R1_ROSCH|nr:hypothetical protein RchiOBHm_Chr2g0165221 [Rosa chinensis]